MHQLKENQTFHDLGEKYIIYLKDSETYNTVIKDLVIEEEDVTALVYSISNNELLYLLARNRNEIWKDGKFMVRIEDLVTK